MTETITRTEIKDKELIYEAKISGKMAGLIQSILRRNIITAHIKQIGIELTPIELQQAADRFRIVHQLETAEATKQWLADGDFSLDDFEYIVTQDVLAHKLAEHLFGERVEQFFHQHILDYSGAILYEVTLEDPDLAMELFYSLQEGDLSFADVAHQYSSELELRRRGGYIGKVSRKQLHPEISAAVFAAKPPQLISPITTAVGVHLIQVEEIITPKLDERLYSQILGEMFDRWLAAKVTEIDR
jgi:parvulin-like peptidyl-prolyl isomerase